jgi:competence protein ComEC
MTSRSLGHRAPLLWLLLPYMAGLAIGKAGDFLPVSWLLALALVAVLIAGAALIMGGRRAALWGPALISAMVVAGAASYALHRLRLATWETLPPREASLGLQVDRVFVPADPKRASGLATIVRAAPHLRELIGQPIYFSLNLRAGEVPPIRSALVTATGILVTLPRNPPAETFDGYLAGAGINFRFTRGRLTAEDRPAHPYYRFCAELGKRCHELLGLGIETKRPALAGLLRAMMLGTTHDLSTEQHTLFMQSGTMHLFAISGLNIGVIAGVLQAGLLLLRFPGWARFVVGAGLLWVFVDVTGAAPSAIRAFAMAVFIQAAFVFRRPANMLAALVASAFAVLLLWPLQMFSASFLMSYFIVTALLVLGLPLGEAWVERWAPWRDLPVVTWGRWHRAVDAAWRNTTLAVAIGLATTLVSLLTGLQFFQLLTPGALAANLVLIPAAVIVTLGGFASIMCGLIGFTPGAVLCNHAAAVVLLIIEWLVRLSVKIPGAFLAARFAHPWVGPASLIALLAALLAGYAAAWRPSRGSWWPPFAIVALVLIFGVNFG